MRSSCINWVEREPLIIIRRSQIDLCEGSRAAAALLSFFEYWHNKRLDSQGKSKRQNDVAEQHGEERAQDESLMQFHTKEQLSNGILGIAGKAAVEKAIKYLEDKGYISIHRNPNPRYKFDNTNHYLFHPERVISDLNRLKAPENKTLSNRYGRPSQKEVSTLSNRDSRPSQIDTTITPNQYDHHPNLIGTISETTNEITNENKTSLSLPQNLRDTEPDDGEVEGRERENFQSENQKSIQNNSPDSKNSPAVAKPAPEYCVPPLDDKNRFVAPVWLDLERWQGWIASRPKPPLTGFGERTECKRLGWMIAQGWGQAEILDDAIVRNRERLAPPCKPGDEKKILEERKAKNPLPVNSQAGKPGKRLQDLRVELRNVELEIIHLDEMISRLGGGSVSPGLSDTRVSLEDQRKTLRAKAMQIRSELERMAPAPKAGATA